MVKIKGNFNWNKPEVYTSFIQGKDAKAIYEALKGSMKNEISYDEKTKTLIGSNTFAVAKIDTILKPLGIRVANLRDLSRPEVMNMVKGNFYTDTPALILRSTSDSYERNLPLIKQLTEKIEKANGKVKFPLMITGFDVKEGKSGDGYNIIIVPRKDFKAISDERLKGNYHGEAFSEVDEIGLPKFDKNGKRNWYARNQGLSGLYLNGLLNLNSDIGYLAYSYGIGRVVVVDDRSSQKNLESKFRFSPREMHPARNAEDK